MKAVQISEWGKPEGIIINADLPEPQPKAGQIQVKVIACAINPFDLALKSGIYQEHIPVKLPYIPCGDFSGTIVKLGKEVSEYKIGDEIFGSAMNLSGGSGALAQITTANITSIAPKPLNINFIESASLPLVGVSAVQALIDNIKLQKKQKILIHGGAGGIGTIAIQLARHLGAYVATTAKKEDIKFLKKLGADEVIDYKNEKFEVKLTDFDAVYDTVGGETTKRSFKVLKKEGILVSMKGAPDKDLADKYQLTVFGQNTKIDSKHLSLLAGFVNKKVIKPQVAKIFKIDNIKEAFSYLETGSPNGKVVVEIGQI